MLVNLPNPRLFGARKIVQLRNISAPIRQHATWDAENQVFTSWDESVLGAEPTIEELESSYVSTVKSIYSAKLAEKRYEVEIGGVLINGIPVETDRNSQMLLNGAVSFVGKRPTSTIKWKAGNGAFVELNSAQIDAIGVAVAEHVQNCFSREAELSALIDSAATVADLSAIDSQITNFSY